MEHTTQTLFMNVYKNETGKYPITSYNIEPYNTIFIKCSKNNTGFRGRPDGSAIIDDNLLIVECKPTDLQKAKCDLEKYKNNINCLNYKPFYVSFIGTCEENTKYIIYDSDFNITSLQFKSFIKNINLNKTMFDMTKIHEVNQYMYDNGINLPTSQKTLFIASMLLCLKQDKDFVVSRNLNEKSAFNVSDSILSCISLTYNDVILNSQFEFIRKNINNKHLLHIINMISTYIINFEGDILNTFYNEFCLWDKNNDPKIGVVLTPPDKVKLMCGFSNIESNHSVLDICTGTGSFLVEAGKYSKNLIGCENNDERYALAKCNLLLHDLSTDNLYHNDCFNQEFPMVDKCIINPPFSTISPTEGSTKNTTQWKKYKYEKKFILYAIEHLKENGTGCVIVPRSNFNNGKKSVNEFKRHLLSLVRIDRIINCNSKIFQPVAGVNTTIIIFTRITTFTIYKTIIQNHEDDGFTIHRNVRKPIDENSVKLAEKKLISNDESITQFKTLTALDDWNYTINNIENNKEFNDISHDLATYLMNETIYINKLKMISLSATKYEIDKIVKLSDILELVAPFILFSKTDSKLNPTEEYNIPLISSKAKDFGICGYVNKASFDVSEYHIVITYGGSAGQCYAFKNKFSISGKGGGGYPRTFKLKENYKYILPYIKELCVVMTKAFKNKYGFGNSFNIKTMLNEEIPLFKHWILT